MRLPGKEWYSISEVAKRWDIDVDEVIHYLVTGKLRALIQVKERGLTYPLVFENTEGVRFPYPPELSKQEAEKVSKVTSSPYGFFEVSGFHNVEQITSEDNKPITFSIDHRIPLLHNGYVIYLHESMPIQRDVNSIYIGRDEIIRFEEPAANLDGTLPPYLDPTNPFYSGKLAAAIKTWLAIYGDGQPEVKRTGHMAPIREWLRINRKEYGDLANQAIDEIAKIVNANPNGGHPRVSDEHVWDDGKKQKKTTKPTHPKKPRL